MFSTRGWRVHASNDSGPCGCAHRSVRPGIEVNGAFFGETVEIFGIGEGVAIGSEMRTIIFARDPEYIGPIRGSGGQLALEENGCRDGRSGPSQEPSTGDLLTH